MSESSILISKLQEEAVIKSMHIIEIEKENLRFLNKIKELEQQLAAERDKRVKVIGNDVMREIVIQSHKAGQKAFTGCPDIESAKHYYESLFKKPIN